MWRENDGRSQFHICNERGKITSRQRKTERVGYQTFTPGKRKMSPDVRCEKQEGIRHTQGEKQVEC